MCIWSLSRSIIQQIRGLSVTMSGQQKISTFLKPLQQKRTNVDEMQSPPKKPKLTDEPKTPSPSKTPELQKKEQAAEGQENSPSGSVTPLTPEQKCRMDENRISAQIKLTTKKTNGLVVNMGPSWYKALEAEFSKPYFIKLSKFLESERQKHKIFPPAQDVWSWTQMCKIRDVKVVILGQDPYHGPGQAHGLCFSVQQGVTPPPSLVNMYKELSNDIPGFKHPGHGTLTGWSRQGVLLLNAVLTVRAHNANSHKEQGWEKLTDAVITWLNKNMDGLVFILWGSYAQKKGACINKSKHHVLKGVHPSPLSAHRGYFGCKHFSKCNEYLESINKNPIDWTHLPGDC